MLLRATFIAVLELLESDSVLVDRLRTALGLDAEAKPAAPALLDRAGLARELRICGDTLDKLRREPRFPELRVGDSPRFELERVLGWLRERNTGAGLRVVDGGRR